MTEAWKQLPYHEGEFYISNNGNVKNIKTGNILKGDINNGGYRRVGMYNNSVLERRFIHRMVAEHFVDGYKDGYLVNHIDGNKTNNKSTNLEWVNASENMQHAQNTGLLPHGSFKQEVMVEYLSRQQKHFPSIVAASRSIGVSDTTIRHWHRQGNKSACLKYGIKEIIFL